ncbi:hypothetical protein HZB03_04060 [Candidatus Woesearchaeota archaeon]|nr:hypothetical protein [Candidatus Woesearchaeota archaeon]
MDLSVHFVVSAVIAAVLYPFFGWLSVFIIVGGFLIDADHYLWIILSKKALSLKSAYNYHKQYQHRNDYILNVCHTIEFSAIVVVLAVQYTFAALFSLGFFLHLLLDRIHAIRYSRRYNKAFRFFWFNDQKGRRAFSLLHWILVELGIAHLWRFGAVDEQASQVLQQRNVEIMEATPVYRRVAPPLKDELDNIR